MPCTSMCLNIQSKLYHNSTRKANRCNYIAYILQTVFNCLTFIKLILTGTFGMKSGWRQWQLRLVLLWLQRPGDHLQIQP